jgi:hypothetical protein
MVSVEVVIWNASALIALGVSLMALGGALADWEYLRERRINGLRLLQATKNLRTQGTRALVALLFLLVGALALVGSPWTGPVGRWALVAASLVMTVGSVLDWLDRRRMVAMAIQIEAGPPGPPGETGPRGPRGHVGAAGAQGEPAP